MKPEEQRIAIAEAVGWRHCPQSGDKLTNPNAYWYPPNSVTIPPFREPQNMAHFNQLPRYEKCLNAMHEAEKVLTDEQHPRFRYELQVTTGATGGVEMNNRQRRGFVSSTASQRAEAFLRTLNLWKD